MIRVGGNSYTNGIKFSATNYSVNFESYANSTKIFLCKNEGEKTSKVLDFLSGIPLVRGIVCMMRNFKFLFLITLLNIFFGNTNSKSEYGTSLLQLILLFCAFLIVFGYLITKLLKNMKSTWQYHGAEHKVIFTNYEEMPITLENCRKAPRIADDCGTMLVSILIIVFIIINIISMLFEVSILPGIKMLVAFVLSFEIFLLDRNVPIICWIFKLGYWIQEHVCTSEPNDIQLTQAIEAFKLLERAETGKIPDEELQELLQSGQQRSFLDKLF